VIWDPFTAAAEKQIGARVLADGTPSVVNNYQFYLGERGFVTKNPKVIEALFEDLAAWADKPRWAGSGFTRLVVELADLPGHPARRIARRHKAVLESQLAEVLAKANIESPRERAREIWLLSEGAISLMLVHRDRSYAAAAALAAKKLLRLNSAKRK